MAAEYESILQQSSEDLKCIQKIIETSLKDKNQYSKIRNRIEKKKLHIPKALESYVKKQFKISVSHDQLTPRKCFHKIKNSGITESVNNENLDFRGVDTTDLNKLQKHLLANNVQSYCKKYLFYQARYGYYLQCYKDLFDVQFIKGNVYTSWGRICRDMFNVSDSYGRKLRWIGSLAHKFTIFRCSSLTLDKLYSMRRNIDLISSSNEYSNY